jgi:ribosomal protein S18 acetylase RimI-like enzyme
MRSGLTAQLLRRRDRDAALAHLKREARHNLSLIEMVAAVGSAPSPSEVSPQVVAVWRGGQIAGLASLRPSVVLDHEMTPEVLEACMPFLASLASGLVKSDCHLVAPLWQRLRGRGRRSLVDRIEIAYVLRRERSLPVPSTRRPAGALLRGPMDEDLDALVFAARASLREEGRPDPFDGDPLGFRRWVRGRLPRARVVEHARDVVFVGYADVRRPEGWLIQGVYSWPEARRRGFAAAGMAGLIEEAFAAGADHVQLAVVEDNAAGIGLYESLGFEPFAKLRTVLFV